MDSTGWRRRGSHSDKYCRPVGSLLGCIVPDCGFVDFRKSVCGLNFGQQNTARRISAGEVDEDTKQQCNHVLEQIERRNRI